MPLNGPGGFWPHGTTMTFGDVPVSGLRTVPVEGGAKGQVDVTGHHSGGRERTVPGLKSAPTSSIEMLLIPGDPGQEKMLENHEAAGANIEEVVITAPESVLEAGYPQEEWTFDTYVLDWSTSLPHDNNPATITFQLSTESDPVRAVIAGGTGTGTGTGT